MNTDWGKLIERYLDHDLSEEGTMAFEEELHRNAGLQEELSLHLDIHAAAIRTGERMLITKVSKQYHTRQNLKWLSIVALVLSVLIFIAYFFFSKKSDPSVSEKNHATKGYLMETKSKHKSTSFVLKDTFQAITYNKKRKLFEPKQAKLDPSESLALQQNSPKELKHINQEEVYKPAQLEHAKNNVFPRTVKTGSLENKLGTFEIRQTSVEEFQLLIYPTANNFLIAFSNKLGIKEIDSIRQAQLNEKKRISFIKRIKQLFRPVPKPSLQPSEIFISEETLDYISAVTYSNTNTTIIPSAIEEPTKGYRDSCTITIQFKQLRLPFKEDWEAYQQAKLEQPDLSEELYLSECAALDNLKFSAIEEKHHRFLSDLLGVLRFYSKANGQQTLLQDMKEE